MRLFNACAYAQRQSDQVHTCIRPRLRGRSMNPFKRRRTVHQERAILAARKQLRNRWNADPFTTGQPSGYSVRHVDEDTECDATYDVVEVRRAARSMTPAWMREQSDRRRLVFEHTGDGAFCVRVPQSDYLHTQWLPVSTDVACVTYIVTRVVLVALLLFGAFSAAIYN